MTLRLTTALASILLISAAPAVASTGVEPRPGAFLTGSIHFPRKQAMTFVVDGQDTSRATATVGFDGRCKGGGVGEFWASNVPARETIKIRNGRFTAKLTGVTHNVNGVKGRDGVFHWQLKGRFVDRDTAVATVSGKSWLRSGGHVVSRCKIADPGSVRLTIGR
jgi:hypothetical protein